MKSTITFNGQPSDNLIVTKSIINLSQSTFDRSRTGTRIAHDFESRMSTISSQRKSKIQITTGREYNKKDFMMYDKSNSKLNYHRPKRLAFILPFI
jgi:hypothetical protein